MSEIKLRDDGIPLNNTNGRIRHKLTERQTEILDLIVGYELTSQDIANRLCISMKTVRLHEAEIRRAYNTSSTQIAVIRYLKELYGTPLAKDWKKQQAQVIQLSNVKAG